MVIIDHREMIDPHNGPQSLNPRRLIIAHEVSNE